MAIAPTLALAAPPTNPAARRYNILNAVVGPLDMPDSGRLVDLAYTVPWCGGTDGVAITPECTSIENDFGDPLYIAEGVATTLQRAFTCLAPGLKPEQVETFARDRLEGSEHVLIEAAIAARLAASTPTDLGTGTTIIDVVSLLESYAYTLGGTVNAEDTQGYGLAAVIHMPIAAWAHLAAEDQIRRDQGGVWRTPLGSIVAPNAGITTATAYVTGQVVIWRAPSAWVPPAEQALDRTTNEYKMLAQRDYVAAWECFTGSATLGVLA